MYNDYTKETQPILQEAQAQSKTILNSIFQKTVKSLQKLINKNKKGNYINRKYFIYT